MGLAGKAKMFMEFVNYIILVLKKTFEVVLISMFPFIFIAFLMQILSGFIRNKLSLLIGAKAFAYFTSVGVMVHELGHLIFAVIFRHKITEVSLFKPQADGTLGSISHSYNPKSIYQRIGNFFIGTGPIWGGVILVYFLSKLFLPNSISATDATLIDNVFRFFDNFFSINFLLSLKGFIYLYLVFVISLNITLSPPDIKGAFDGLGIILITLLLLIFSTLWYVDLPVIITDFFQSILSIWLPVTLITFLILILSYCILLVLGRIKSLFC